MKTIEKWIETRSFEGWDPGGYHSMKLFRGYKVGKMRFDREEHVSYAAARAAAEAYCEEDAA